MHSILNGDVDDDLDRIQASIKQRREYLASMTVSFLREGDTVRFSDRIRPKYLQGKTATVVKVNQKTIVVDCPSDPSYGRFSGSKKVRCPNELIEGLA